MAVQDLRERRDQALAIRTCDEKGRNLRAHAENVAGLPWYSGRMNLKNLTVVLGVCVLGGGLVSAQPKPADKKMAEPAVDLAALADRIVTKTANVKEGEIVQIHAGPQDIAFAEELAVAVRKKGAHPILTYWSESAAKKMIAAAPEKYDGQVPAGDIGLAKLINVLITIPPVRDPSIAGALPPARRAAQSKAGVVVGDISLKRSIRLVEVGNGMYPTPLRSKLTGQSEAELGKVFWDGVSADYAGIEDKAKSLKATLAAGSELRITLPNGTDLKMKVKARKVLTSDGVISDADIKAGGANVNAWLPAGEVYLTPVAGSAEGKIVDDRMVFEGKEVTGVTAEVKAGKITSITAKTGWDGVKGVYDAAGAGKNEIGLVDFGINPAVKAAPKNETYVAAGMVTIGTGGNVWAGGTNKEPFSLQFFLTGATVTLDGKPIVEAGTLK